MNGRHYSETAEAWLRNLGRNREEILPLFARTYGKREELRGPLRWRIFFMPCAERWGLNKGGECTVSHYRSINERDPMYRV